DSPLGGWMRGYIVGSRAPNMVRASRADWGRSPADGTSADPAYPRPFRGPAVERARQAVATARRWTERGSARRVQPRRADDETYALDCRSRRAGGLHDGAAGITRAAAGGPTVEVAWTGTGRHRRRASLPSSSTGPLASRCGRRGRPDLHLGIGPERHFAPACRGVLDERRHRTAAEVRRLDPGHVELLARPKPE